MAFTRATGKHRRPSRLNRSTAQAAGIAALTTTGVVGTLAGPALAADEGTRDTGLIRAVDLGQSMAAQIDDQAAAQQEAAEVSAALAKAERDAQRHAAEAKRTAEAKAKKIRAAKAKKAREAKERAARAAERKRLGSYVLPITGSYVSTGYHAGSSLWSSGSHTGIDFHAATGTPVHAVGSGTVVEAGWGGAYGNNVVLRMHDGTYTQYGHLSSIGVSVGQTVTPGRQLGLSGATGNVTGPHLHFEARTGPDYGSDINPLTYLRSHGLSV
ncbi:M23 family metallopeptidase [Streptomyces sp. NPDC058045]|uniref:M23 family metallopeptidase n=1 Tax=Streptomyces sp. NPDC058045 TaxID=3346311 RepID=UPI0036E11422